MPGNVYFYNMTNQSIQLTVNTSPQQTVNAMPTTPPYNPNAATPAYTRYAGVPQNGQVGDSNTVTYTQSGGSNPVTITLKINHSEYNTNFDLLVYMFSNSMIAVSVIDYVAYLGQNGSTINMSTTGGGTLQL